DDTPYNIHIIDLFKDDYKVGFIALEKHDDRMNISSVEVNKEERHHGIAESALRQLSTYIRIQFGGVKLLTITLYGENNELKPLCINSNFVEIDAADDFIVFEKYLNY
ncbi:GNAT family N-acetyltransferase, partial [Staphylococcus succinus]